jgi:hypothetical protein
MMAIDDNPIKTVKKQFEMESLSTSPVTERALDLVSSLPLPYPLDKIVEGMKKFLATDTAEKDRLLVETIANEVVKHAEELGRIQTTLAEHESRLSPEAMISLFVDAMRKAESTRAGDRVRRVGLILANAIIEKSPAEADEIEELMRVATELSDRDVELLRELVRIEGDIVRTQGRIARYDAFTKWEQGSWGTRVMPELDSVFSKLESYGLVSRIPPPNNLNIMADYQNRYLLLSKGARFVDLIRSRSAPK